jgi:hypothetical protein
VTVTVTVTVTALEHRSSTAAGEKL